MNWQPSADIAVLKQRDIFNRQIRAFFQARGYWEVETPYMGQYGVTDIHLSCCQKVLMNLKTKKSQSWV
jgi:lysyl-tRNA synthetase class 2